MTIGRHIKARRLEKALTRKELGKKAGVSPIEIWRIENDKRKNINLQIISRIAKALDFSLVSMLIESGFSSPLTQSEKSLMTDPDFAKIFFELERRRDLNPADKKQLADILFRVVKSFEVK